MKVRFSPTVARYVTESNWHSSQKLTPQKDGSLIAEFDLDHTEEIKRWIQSFGRHALLPLSGHPPIDISWPAKSPSATPGPA